MASVDCGSSATAGFYSGLATGNKAVVNGSATAVRNVFTLGTLDTPVEWLPVTEEDRANGYDTAVAIATGSGEVLVGVMTGGAASALSKGGKVARLGGLGLVILDASGNVVGAVRGAYDAATNGVTLQNSAQTIGCGLGFVGNVSGFRGPGRGGAAAEVAPSNAARTWQEASISPAHAKRIQNAATKTRQTITVVGSRAKGTATGLSDWDYIVSGRSRLRGRAKNSVPRGVAGGELSPSGQETGIDWWQDYNPNAPGYMPIDPSRPHVSFEP
jgi:hypothetical protein